MLLAQGFALRAFVEKIEYLFNPVSSIQYRASWLIAGAARLSKQYGPIINQMTLSETIQTIECFAVCQFCCGHTQYLPL